MNNLITNDWNLKGTEAQEWTDAANAWRLPYWDWAFKQTYCEDFALPLVFTNPTVHIWPPQSVIGRYPTPRSYLNPLWGFDNPETDNDGNPLPLGHMPSGKEQYNIKDDIQQGGTPGEVSKKLLPVSICRCLGVYQMLTSRSGAKLRVLVVMAYSLATTLRGTLVSTASTTPVL